MNFLKKLADSSKQGSLADSLRNKRFLFFKSLIKDLQKPLTILDVGGTQNFWERMGYINDKEAEITLFNLHRINNITLPNLTSIKGDAKNLAQFEENQFDIVFSNSVLEHVGDFADQMKMSKEIMRVGKRLFVQTPNRFFPIEPHYLFPFFQFFPFRIKVLLVRNFNIGWVKKTVEKDQAKKRVQSIKLLTKSELRVLFPECSIFEERLLGFTKSFVVYKGF